MCLLYALRERLMLRLIFCADDVERINPMLKSIGASIGGGDMAPEKQGLVRPAIERFEEILGDIVTSQNITRRYVRPLLTGSVICGYLNGTFYVGYTQHIGMPTVIFTNLTGTGNPDIITFYAFLLDSFGVDFCVLELKEEWLGRTDLDATLRGLAHEVITRELSRHKKESSIVSHTSIFGPNHFPVQESLVFVLMPFVDELTNIYSTFVKPTIESKNLVCRRADDIHSNDAIINDIWKSICEARFVVADISSLNPNVMYELGIAHAIGKETILIRQKDGSKHPFDVAHIRIIEYENTAVGGPELTRQLDGVVNSVLAKLKAASLKAT